MKKLNSGEGVQPFDTVTRKMFLTCHLSAPALLPTDKIPGAFHELKPHLLAEASKVTDVFEYNCVHSGVRRRFSHGAAVGLLVTVSFLLDLSPGQGSIKVELSATKRLRHVTQQKGKANRECSQSFSGQAARIENGYTEVELVRQQTLERFPQPWCNQADVSEPPRLLKQHPHSSSHQGF